MFNKVGQLIKNAAEATGVGAAIQYGMNVSQVPQALKDFAGHSFDLLSGLPLSDTARSYLQHAPFGGSLFFVVSTRIGDAIGNRLAFGKCFPKNEDLIKAQATWRGHLAKNFASATWTVLSGAAAGAILSAASGPVTVPAVVSVAALAAVVWTLTKVADAAIFMLKTIATNLMCCRKQTPITTESENKNNNVSSVEDVNKLVVVHQSPENQSIINIDFKSYEINKSMFAFKPSAIKLLNEKIDIVNNSLVEIEKKLENVKKQMIENAVTEFSTNENIPIQKIATSNDKNLLGNEKKKLEEAKNRLYDLLMDWQLLLTEEELNEITNADLNEIYFQGTEENIFAKKINIINDENISLQELKKIAPKAIEFIQNKLEAITLLEFVEEVPCYKINTEIVNLHTFVKKSLITETTFVKENKKINKNDVKNKEAEYQKLLDLWQELPNLEQNYNNDVSSVENINTIKLHKNNQTIDLNLIDKENVDENMRKGFVDLAILFINAKQKDLKEEMKQIEGKAMYNSNSKEGKKYQEMLDADLYLDRLRRNWKNPELEKQHKIEEEKGKQVQLNQYFMSTKEQKRKQQINQNYKETVGNDKKNK